MSFKKCLVNHIKKHPLIIIILISLVILSSLSVLLPPFILTNLVDKIIKNKETDKVLLYASTYMLSNLFIYLISYIEGVILVFIAKNLEHELRLEMMKKIERLDYLTLSSIDSGILESYFTSDIESISLLVTDGVISLIIDSVKIISIMVSIFIYSIYFGLFVLCVIPFITLFTLYIKKKMFNTLKTTKKLEAIVNNKTLETLDNITVIKSYRIYDDVKNKYHNLINDQYKSKTKSSNYDSFFSPVINIIKYILIVSLIIFGVLNSNAFALTSGAVISMIDLISNLFTPLESLSMEIQTLEKSTSSISRINEFFMLKEKDKETIDNINLDNINLKFDNVSFFYKENEMVIKDFNYSLKDNDKLTLVGRTGSGKSTLFKLSYGLLKPTCGHVTINDSDVYLFKDGLKEKLFAVLSQDVFFTGGTIKDEVTLLKDIPEGRVYDILNKVGLERIKDINQKFNISDYSLGELELFNIARVLLSDAKIILLDEFNAKIDSNITNKVTNLINILAKDKMVISINHYKVELNNTKILQINKINV